jgi:hypothetical protein
MFLKAAGPALVKRVAEILQKQGIPLMPLKGVLLQKLVYGEQTFRPISDVDILVPEAQFPEACRALRREGFTEEHWELGGWQVTLRDPTGPPLGVDLHRRIARTSRARLSPEGMFQRGVRDAHVFGVPVTLPCPEDLFAHLLLHATLHWLKQSSLHRPQDFEWTAGALALDVDRCARHLSEQGLLIHARLMLPLIAAEASGDFIGKLALRLPSPASARASTWLVRALAARYPQPGHLGRRLAGLALAPSLAKAITAAIRDRIRRANADAHTSGNRQASGSYGPEVGPTPTRLEKDRDGH